MRCLWKQCYLAEFTQMMQSKFGILDLSIHKILCTTLASVATIRRALNEQGLGHGLTPRLLTQRTSRVDCNMPEFG